MISSVDIRDDPSRPEGGHALVLFRDAVGPTGRGTLCIEPLTENYVYAGPREVEIHADRDSGGLLVPVGDGALDQLAPGIAVRLSIAGTDIEAETLWPNLTPRPRMAKRRAPMAQGRKREVVEPASGHGPRPQPPVSSMNRSFSSLSNIEAEKQRLDRPPDDITAGPIIDRTDGPPSDEQAGEADVPRDDKRDAVQDAREDTPKDNRPPDPETSGAEAEEVKARGWSTAVLAGIAVGAFALGAAASFAIHSTIEKPPSAPSPSMLALPSLYAALADLQQVSPDGTRVEGRDWRKFLTRSRAARSPEERSFWRKWAMRAVLDERSNGAGTALVDFATDLAGSRPDEANLATARLLWELAAVAGDCGAMSNIAKTLAKPDTHADEALWTDRARRCVGGRARP